MEHDKVLIITLNLNQVDYTLKCINSLLHSSYENFQILLIDNGSTQENYTELLANIPINKKVLLHRLEENRGYVGGINYGLNEAKKLHPDYVLIMNNDTIIDTEAIRALVCSCKKFNDKAIVTGKIFYYDNPTIIQTLGNEFRNKRRFETYMVGQGEQDHGQYDKEVERAMIDDIFWLFPAKLVDEIGYYSDWYGFGFEQADFAQRAKSKGYKLVFTPGAKLLHKINATAGHQIRTPFKEFWGIQGHLMFEWSYISKIAFIKPYIFTIREILIAFGYNFLRLFSKKIEKRMPLVKILAFARFHIWIFLKMPSNQFIPDMVKYK